MTKTLTTRQDNFIFYYAKSGNATQAAIRAGYSPRTARQQGSRLLTKAYIHQRLNAAGQTGLNALEDICLNGKNERAQVQAAKTLVELAYGKAPILGVQQPDIRINVRHI